MEDKLLVIKESDLNKLTKSAGVTYPTFPASEVFEAALTYLNYEEMTNEEKIDCINDGTQPRKYPTYTDYETQVLTSKNK